ncbi:histidine kinase dimerization/phospho-acceptor domain-containing protein [Sphingorhabdus sp. Alg231-15]|uniref:histidine kinase dimerization/phospho-acceptor domain-containing protein n=1 Tax=Sphingorhabdus sp. Alg231-15 TaxID=1922222 RepID=UPI000D55DFAF
MIKSWGIKIWRMMFGPGARTISFRTRLFTTLGALLILAICASVANFYGTTRSNLLFERNQLANNVVHSYSEAAMLTERLVKKMNVAVNQPPNSSMIAITEVKLQIQEQLDIARQNIAREVELVGKIEDEAAELEELAALERLIGRAINQFDEILILRDSGQVEMARERFLAVVSEQIDGQFSESINALLAEERSEIEEAQRNIQFLGRQLTVFAGVIIVLALLFVSPAVLRLSHIFNRSMTELQDGLDHYGQNKFDYSIPELPAREFDYLGHRFNHMAEQIGSAQKRLMSANAGLEETVSSRTKELEEANKALVEKDEGRKRLFADISHELRTPLTVIRGEAEISLRGKKKNPEEYESSLKLIADQAIHTARLIDDLLFVARSQAGELKLVKKPVDIAALVAEKRKTFEALATKKNIEIVTEKNISDMVVVGDRGRLGQVFAILLDNAIRYAPADTAISVYLNSASAGVAITVDNVSEAVSDDDLRHIFNRFYRGDNAGQLDDGTGLGLPVAKAIVEAHDGSIGIARKDRDIISATVILAAEKQMRIVS